MKGVPFFGENSSASKGKSCRLGVRQPHHARVDRVVHRRARCDALDLAVKDLQPDLIWRAQLQPFTLGVEGHRAHRDAAPLRHLVKSRTPRASTRR